MFVDMNMFVKTMISFSATVTEPAGGLEKPVNRNTVNVLVRTLLVSYPCS